MANFYNPEVNAGLGLVFRLNDLWAKADRRALSGNLNAWELVLDRIFSNLLYREDIETEENGDEEIIDVQLSSKDLKIQSIIKDKIMTAKSNHRTAIKEKKKINSSRTIHYASIMLYDIWLRKFMQSLGGLYLKETESNPSKAMFGGAFQGKKGRGF